MTDNAFPIAFTVTNARVQHYADVVEHLANIAVAKYEKDYGKQPTTQQLAFFKKEVVRYAVIRKDVDTASKLTIKPQEIL